MIYFSIKDLENLSGIKAHTIRTWEQRFSFLQPKRSQGLRRTYNHDELKLILNMSFLNRNGYKVSHIASLNKGERNALLLGLTELHHKQERAVNELICCMVMMDIEGFSMVLHSCEIAWGIDVTLTEVIYPFLEKTGLLLHAGYRNYEANLLLVEQSVKQKIIAGIEKGGNRKVGQTALFFLCKKKSEHRLLYLQYQFKLAGFSVLYISSAVVTSQLCAIINAIKPAYVITATGGKKQQCDLKNFSEYLNKQLPQTVFLDLENMEPLPFENMLQTTNKDADVKEPTNLYDQTEYSCLTR